MSGLEDLAFDFFTYGLACIITGHLISGTGKCFREGNTTKKSIDKLVDHL
jgi:hypothetical protein